MRRKPSSSISLLLLLKLWLSWLSLSSFHPLSASAEATTTTTTTTTTRPLKYALFIGHRVNWDLTVQAVEGTLELGAENIRLIDTSASLTSTELEERRLPSGVQVLDPIIPLCFSAMQEYMRKTAIKEGLDVYFWIHSDVLLAKGTASKALEAVEAMMETYPSNWGILFFSYDLFCAFSVQAVSNLSWDLAIPHYKADFDYYQRMKNSGYGMYGSGALGYAKPAPRNIPWPKAHGSIKHVSKGSVLMREMQAAAADAIASGESFSSSSLSSTNKQQKQKQPQQLFSKEEQWGYWLSDYVGRYVYFFLKWGYAWPEHQSNNNNNNNDNVDYFNSVDNHRLWSILRIFLRLPAPSPNMKEWKWHYFKIYVVVSLFTIPVLLLLLFLWWCLLPILARQCGYTNKTKKNQQQQQHKQQKGRLLQWLPCVKTKRANKMT